MDYEKAYKEALGRANAKIETYNHLGNASVVKSICEIFPELRESEDERIRKAIINIFASHKDYEVFFGASVEDILAWLEKQDEKKSYWNEEDERMYQSIIDDTVQKYLLDGNQFAWLESLKDRVQPQPKQEWSEEDKKKINGICNCLMCSDSPEGYAEWIDWLKSLQSRINIQQNQDWSEEDEKKIMWLVRLISTAGFRELENDKMPCNRIELLDWLKSLKTNHWKPSKEQTMAIEIAINVLTDKKFHIAANHLKSIYDAIKNL